MSTLHLGTKALLYFKQESTYGTDPLALTLSASELIDVYDLTTDPNGLETIVRPAMKSNISPIRGIPGKQMKTITFKVPLWTYAGSNAAAPRWTALLRGCACASPATTQVTKVSPSSLTSINANGPASFTFYAVSNSTTYEILKGCRGTFKISTEAKAHPYVEFTFTGFYVAPGPYSALTVSGGTAEVTEELAFQAASFALQVDGSTNVDMPPVSKIEFDMGNKVEVRPSVVAASGYAEFFIAGREPTLKFDVERDLLDLVNNDNLWEAWKAGGNSIEAVLTFHGSRMVLTATGVIKDLPRGDKNGIETYDVTLGLYGDDDEFSLEVQHDA